MLAHLERMREAYGAAGRDAAHGEVLPRRGDRAPDADRGDARALPGRRRTAAGCPGRARGPTYFEQPVLDGAVAALDAAGWQVHVHAIGDRATRSALDAFEPRGIATARRGLRHTIAHVEVARIPTTSRASAALDVLANLQLQWAQRDPYTVDHLRAPPRRGALGGPLPRGARSRRPARRCAAAATGRSTRCCRSQLETAVTRTSAGAPGGGGAAASPRRPSRCAPRSRCTRARARSSSIRRPLTGRIAPGLAADLIVLDRDLLAIPVGEIAQTGVELTMIGGRVVHRALTGRTVVDRRRLRRARRGRPARGARRSTCSCWRRATASAAACGRTASKARPARR